MRSKLREAPPDDDDVEQQVDADDRDREPDRLAEAPQEHRADRAASSTRVTRPDGGASRGTKGFSMMCAVASAADSVIVMMKSVAAKPSRHEHEGLAPPPRQQLLEHRDAALAVRAVRRDAVVDRQRPEQRHQDEDERGQRREVRRRETRCRAGIRASRSSRRRSGT